MKKIIISALLFLSLVAPISASAITPQIGEELSVELTEAQLKAEIVSLLKQLISILQQQLVILQAQELRASATPQIMPAKNPTPAPTPEPTPTPEAPAPKVEKLALSIQSAQCNLAKSNLQTEYTLKELLANGNVDGRITMNAYVLGEEGRNFYDSNPSHEMKITTSDGSNDKVLKGSGNTGRCGYFYGYNFYTVKEGTFHITFAIPELELTRTITILVK